MAVRGVCDRGGVTTRPTDHLKKRMPVNIILLNVQKELHNLEYIFADRTS
jgi:hypothetical protein